MLIGVSSYSVAAPIVKMCYLHNPTISEYEIVYWKSISMVLFNYLFIRSFGVFPMDVPRKYQNLIVFRACIGFFGLQGLWGAVRYMPVTVASCIFFTAPIWTALLAHCLFKESMSRWDIISIAASFLGVLIVNNPFAENNSESKRSFHDLLLGTIYAVTGALGCSAAFLCMRHMREGIHYTISPFWFASGCSFMSPLLFCFTHNADDKQSSTVYDRYTILLIFLSSFFSFFGQVF